MKTLLLRHALAKAATMYPLLAPRMALRQANRWLRAKSYVARMPARKWVAGPTVLKEGVR